MDKLFETKVIEERWNEIEKSKKQKEKVLVAAITSDANSFCQNKWLGKILFLESMYDILIFENSDTIENYKKLQHASHNYPNFIAKRGATKRHSTFDKIVDNRNLVLNYIRKYKGYTHVLFIDSDIFPESNILTTFLKRKDLDIQCGLCFIKMGSDMKRPALNFFPVDIKNGNVVKWMDTRKPRLIKIAQNGLGCVFMKTNILRKHKNLKFYNKKIKKNGKLVLNEDLTFTGSLQTLGYNLWLDLQAECSHIMK